MNLNQLFESPQQCPECGGISFSDLILAEKKDACYYKVKASAKVWPSAYASGRLVQCRKKGASNYGNKSESVAEGFSNDMSTEDMIAYLRQHHDKNLHSDYLNHLTNTNSKFVLKNIPLTSIRTELSGLDRAKVEQYKKMDFSKAPPIVVGSDGNILDGYHRANVAKALGIPTVKAYVGIKGQQGVAEGMWDQFQSIPELEQAIENLIMGYKGGINLTDKGRAQLLLSINKGKRILAKKKQQQDMAEGSELKQAKRKYNQAAKDANLDQVGAGKKIDTMKKSLRQKDLGKEQVMAEGMKADELSRYCEELVAEKGWDAAYKHARFMAAGATDPAWGSVLKYLDAMKQGMAEETVAYTNPTAPGAPTKADWAKARSDFDKQYPTQQAYNQRQTELWGQKYPGVPAPTNLTGDTEANRQAQLKSLQGVPEGEQRKGDKEVDYDDDYHAMVARVKKLAGLGPMKTVYDSTKRQYRNMPTAQQPKK